MKNFYLVGWMVSGFILSAASAAEVVYVRSPQAKVFESPRFDSKVIAEQTRGTALEVVLHQAAWWQVKLKDGKAGWISQAFVQSEPVAPSSEALAQAEANDPRNVRRRGPRAASMGVRGLSSGAGKLRDKDADVEALEKVEKQNVKPQDIQIYRKELNQDR